MLKQPLVSVLMPVFNSELYVAEAIQSILNQTYKNIELVIANDASTDSTLDIINKYSARDKRIRVITNDKNLYIAANRNMLIGQAKGEFLVWADADDISMPKRIEDELRVLLADSSIGICGGYMQIFGNPITQGQLRKYPKEDGLIRRKIFRYTSVAQPAAMLRKSVFEAVGVYDLDKPPAEDLDMLFRIGERYKFANVSSQVIKYRDHPNSATYKKLRKIELVSVRLRFKYLKNNAYSPRISDVIYNLLHWCSIWVIPPKLKIAIFNRLRNE